MARGTNSRVWLALWTVYLVWGSTYLAIRFAVRPSHGEGLPPLLMAGTRFTLAGVILFLATVRRPARDGHADPLGWRQWGACAVIGAALLVGGNGLVTIAERHVASGITAVILATVPIWTATASGVLGTERLIPRQVAGLVLGLGGVAILVLSGGGHEATLGGALLVVVAALTWAAGSYWSRSAPVPRRPLVMTGMQMICGGVLLLMLAAVTGEFGDLSTGRVPASAWIWLGYLVVVGSMVGYTAYIWLLQNTRLSLATTYAYVNPIVAVILGVAFAGEELTARTLIATAVVIGGVVLIISRRTPTTQPPLEAAPVT